MIGGMLFALFAALGNDRVERDDVIRVTEGDVDRLRSLWIVQYKRPPTGTELGGLVEAHVREEVLNREAKLLGLDRDDVIIRRRLAQKMEFLTEDFATAVPPSDEAIATYYEEHLDDYRIPAGVTFSHLFFNADQRGAAGAERAANSVLKQLNDSGVGPDGARDQGDPFVLPLDLEAQSRQEVESLFGNSDLVTALFEVLPGAWYGPVSSAYGVHIIYVYDRTDARTPALASVRERVRGDLIGKMRRDANEAFYGALLKKYTIIVEAEQ